MSVEAFYSLYVHYQLVSGFTNAKGEINNIRVEPTFAFITYICIYEYSC